MSEQLSMNSSEYRQHHPEAVEDRETAHTMAIASNLYRTAAAAARLEAATYRGRSEQAALSGKVDQADLHNLERSNAARRAEQKLNRLADEAETEAQDQYDLQNGISIDQKQ